MEEVLAASLFDSSVGAVNVSPGKDKGKKEIGTSARSSPFSQLFPDF